MCTRPRVLWTCHFSHGFWLKSLRTLFHVFSYHVLSFFFKISALLLNRVRSWKVAEARGPGGLCTLGSGQQEQPPPILSLPLFLPISLEGSWEHVSLHLNLPSPIPSQNPSFSLTCCFLSSTPQIKSFFYGLILLSSPLSLLTI